MPETKVDVVVLISLRPCTVLSNQPQYFIIFMSLIIFMFEYIFLCTHLTTYMYVTFCQASLIYWVSYHFGALLSWPSLWTGNRIKPAWCWKGDSQYRIYRMLVHRGFSIFSFLMGHASQRMFYIIVYLGRGLCSLIESLWLCSKGVESGFFAAILILD